MDDAELDFPPARSGVKGGIELAGGWLYSGNPRCVAVVVKACDVNLEAALRVFGGKVRFLFLHSRNDLLERLNDAGMRANMTRKLLRPL